MRLTLKQQISHEIGIRGYSVQCIVKYDVKEKAERFRENYLKLIDLQDLNVHACY